MNGSQEKLGICNWQRFCNWLNEVMGKRSKPRLLSNTVDVNWILAQGQTANRGEGFGSCSNCVYLTLYPFDTQSMTAKRCRIWISRRKMMHLATYKAHRGYIYYEWSMEEFQVMLFRTGCDIFLYKACCALYKFCIYISILFVRIILINMVLKTLKNNHFLRSFKEETMS